MKNINRFFAIGLVTTLLAPIAVLGATIKAGDDVSIPAGNEVRDNLYIAGGNVSIGGRVSGDLLVAGGSIVASKDVSQDMAVVGGSITVLGNSGGDVRIVGGNILITGDVAGDLIVMGGSVAVSSDVVVGKDLIIAGGQIVFDGMVRGNAQIAGGVVTLNGRVNGNVKADVGQKITLGENAAIGGKMEYRAKTADVLSKSEQAVVTGGVTWSELNPAEISGAKNVKFIFAAAGALAAWKLISFIIIALVLVFLFKKFSHEVVVTAEKNPLQMLGKGFVAVVVVPVAAIILVVTLLGAALGFVALSVYGLALLFSCVYAGIVAGAWLSKVVYKTNEMTITWKNIIVGATILTVVGLIPLVGAITLLIVFLITVGSIVDVVYRNMRA